MSPSNQHETPTRAEAPLLTVDRLSVSFRTDQGCVTAVDDLSLQLGAGETLGVVGESGCGKTVTSKAIMRLLPEPAGSIGPSSRILFSGIDLARASEKTMRRIRGDRIAMIFQEPMTSLNPVFTVGWQIDEALKYHTSLNRKARRTRAVEMLRLVEIPDPEQRVDEYPHQLSGGMRQRVMIAMALCCEPDILIADEPTTALDVTIQSQILRLMDRLKTASGTAILLITHDLGVVAQVCDRVLVMYAGQVVEGANVEEIFERPRHPYTKALLESIPRSGHGAHGTRLPTIDGMVPDLAELPSGCRFHDRCPYAEARCGQESPPLVEDEHKGQVRCFYPQT